MTDASLVLGHLEDRATLGGEVTLDRERAVTAVARVAAAAGLDVEAAAVGILRVADAEMARALRVMSVERGIDPRGLALVAFGGAGPMHACGLAEDLGIETVLLPHAGGVLSALGLALGDLRRDRAAPFLASLHALDPAELERRFRKLEADTARGFGAARLERRADLRYRGQAFELTVEAGGARGPAELGRRFQAAHEERYGYRIAHEPVELVTIRAAAIVSAEPPRLEPPSRRVGASGAQARDGNLQSRPPRRAHLGAWSDVPVFRDPASVEGPAIIEFPDATCVVHGGWAGIADEAGTLVLERR